MNYLEIQNQVMLDRFSEQQRTAIKFAINSRYGRVWALEPWSFKRSLVSLNVAALDDRFTLAEVGLQKVEAIWSDLPSDFTKLLSDRPELALDWADTNSGNASAFSLIGNTVRLERPVTSSTDLLVLGQLLWTPLVADTDVPLIPLEYHGMLVAGAAADMLLRESDPTWQGEQQSYNDQVNEMRMSYMNVQPLARSAYPSWPY